MGHLQLSFQKQITKWLARKLSSSDHRTLLSKPLIFFFPSSCSPLLVYSYFTISSRIFEDIPQNGPEYSHRNLAIARFLVTAVRKNIGGLLSWVVSLSSSVPELTRHGLKRGLHVNPYGGRVLQNRGTFR